MDTHMQIYIYSFVSFFCFFCATRRRRADASQALKVKNYRNTANR